jgi:endonuclease/exonuclease/phosphatase family metal-dependent hydrolase
MMKAFTWNVSGGQKSEESPDSWLLEDQRNQLVDEVLRWDCDVVALQEVESREPIERLTHRYSHVGSSVVLEGVESEGSIERVARCHSHVGSSRSHQGFVQLYVSKTLNFVHRAANRPGVVVCSLLLKDAAGDVEHPVRLAAVHLPSGMGQDKVRATSSILDEIVSGAGENGVFILGDMNCEDDEAMDVCEKNHLGEACYTGSSCGSKSNRYDAGRDYERVGLRYDRMFVSGGVWAESFVACYRRTFFEGCEFFLSDHFPVVGFFEFNEAFQESCLSAIAMARVHRARIVAVRDSRLREEQLESFELLKRGREDNGYAKDVAFDQV